ncbi:hypothetical protein [Halalkalicoccus salilacus]|uniref:hypothetical protein n=1 Tax=Halalkalicoccus sp. GCM10025704 TaxID=3252662 RepID=UPI0036198E03
MNVIELPVSVPPSLVSATALYSYSSPLSSPVISSLNVPVEERVCGSVVFERLPLSPHSK